MWNYPIVSLSNQWHHKVPSITILIWRTHLPSTCTKLTSTITLYDLKSSKFSILLRSLGRFHVLAVRLFNPHVLAWIIERLQLVRFLKNLKWHIYHNGCRWKLASLWFSIRVLVVYILIDRFKLNNENLNWILKI